MTKPTFDITQIVLLSFLAIVVYVFILIVFFYARRKYKGGVVEKVINFIIATTGFLLVADIALFLIPNYGFVISYTIHVIFKIIALTCLAIGGLKFFVR
ncbi:membrane protein [Candidatus Desulfofervidus auxilii]|uniref:Membrane protein n=1 Tax=Desulfofervidus auxilii TaxID=1621989 RepID=A0A7V1P3K1_DESA2|nr:hypothetical protein [Candidatus Desulfofervidus auxilii]CAD7778473.1 hypothetical protein BLFGPEAP_02003 [Candidatus Methanoperedenaceae archaeon GB50]CAD7779654.1 hypothetical protein DMNBHIDG_02136 [Candidatus Methanoperedenaceae archaeon GB37]AMM41515.1 membrane protein [Candidatus Desulfofervidus auxilii]CAD7780919.1 MAG: hypothetical protein KIIPBIDF_01411 [Candidatus Methanoperedenaceae archaeon GB50]CAD7782220.1 MAG: hypothetical protein KCCBMMGE_01276 [Candidatus Methanoperedenacea